MPIVVKDFKWNQTKHCLNIQVPLHGVHPSKVDIFTSSQYIKATFEKFFFEALLLKPVNILKTSCTKTPTEIVFDLKKCVPEIWQTLEILNISKQERMELKKTLIQEEHERIQKEIEERKAKKSELKRVAVHEQIELDTRVRCRIEEIKKDEETKAVGDLTEWKNNLEANNKKTSTTNNKSELIQGEGNKNNKKPVLSQPRFYKTSKSDEKLNVPKLRSTRSLQVLFTNREFPTPCRESRLDEENEFLKKQAEARRSAGFVDEDLRPEEKNPQYLLSKGEEFLRNSNYLGAISAFSFGIKLSPKFLDLYIARSEAHLKCGNFKRAVDDCTSALDLLKPILPINLDNRALCIGRRGIALYKLGFLKQGIAEIKESLKKKNNEELLIVLNDFECQYDNILVEENNKNENK